MADALDMKARTKSVNDKITYAAEVSFANEPPHPICYLLVKQVQTVLRELLTEVREKLHTSMAFNN